jgi:hypothetical protein
MGQTMANRPDLNAVRNYPPPRGNVLLLTCMDLRVLDETIRFMEGDGLTNRYDHLIFAGASLGAVGGKLARLSHWQNTFFDHLKIALSLHHPQDFYIMEHRNCGAYREILKEDGTFGDSAKDYHRETEIHRKYSTLLKTEIESWCKSEGVSLHVHCFLMDLRGEVELLNGKPTRRRPKS